MLLKPFSLLLCLFACTSTCSIDRILKEKTEALKDLNLPLNFVPGKTATSYVKTLLAAPRSPLPPKILVLDLSEFYANSEHLEYLRSEVLRLFKENIDNLDSMRLVSAFLQIDCMLDFVLHYVTTLDTGAVQRTLLNTRKEMLQLLKIRCAHLWTVIDLVSYCPSYRISRLNDVEAYPKLQNSVAPSVFLHHISTLSVAISVDPYDGLNLKIAATALCFSRIENPNLREEEREILISALLDTSLWMTHTRNGFCIASMVRAGLLEELNSLFYLFELDSWNKAVQFLPPILLGNPIVRSLVQQEDNKLNFLSSNLSQKLRDQAPKLYGPIYKLLASDDNLNSYIAENFHSEQDISGIIANEDTLCHFVPIIGVLFAKYAPNGNHDFLKRFQCFTSAVFSPFPVLSVLQKVDCGLKPHKMIPSGAKCNRKSLNPNFAKLMLLVAVKAARNYRSLALASFQNDKNAPYDFDVRPYSNISSLDGPMLFSRIADVLFNFDVKKFLLVPTLEKLGVMPILTDRNSTRLSEHLRTILVDAMIGMHLTSQLNVPIELKNIQGPFCFSQTAARILMSSFLQLTL